MHVVRSIIRIQINVLFLFNSIQKDNHMKFTCNIYQVTEEQLDFKNFQKKKHFL